MTTARVVSTAHFEITAFEFQIIGGIRVTSNDKRIIRVVVEHNGLLTKTFAEHQVPLASAIVDDVELSGSTLFGQHKRLRRCAANDQS